MRRLARLTWALEKPALLAASTMSTVDRGKSARNVIGPLVALAMSGGLIVAVEWGRLCGCEQIAGSCVTGSSDHSILGPLPRISIVSAASR